MKNLRTERKERGFDPYGCCVFFYSCYIPLHLYVFQVSDSTLLGPYYIYVRPLSADQLGVNLGEQQVLNQAVKFV